MTDHSGPFCPITILITNLKINPSKCKRMLMLSYATYSTVSIILRSVKIVEYELRFEEEKTI